MYKPSLKSFFLAKTTHRVPKILALAASSAILVAMVNIDASASAFGGRDSNTVRSDVVLTLASESSNSQFSGLVKRWSAGSSVITTATPTSTTSTVTAPTPPASSGSGGGAGGSGAGGGSGSGGTTTTTAPTTTTTVAPPSTTTTTAPPSTSSASGEPITAGDSRSECLEPDTANVGSAVNSFDAETNSTVTCVLAYLDSEPDWGQWADPWIVGPSGSSYTSWVDQEPQTRQLVLQVDLIPQSLKNISDPLGWEQSCAAGDFDSYATQLGTNLVGAGLGNSVIRLGTEMNGPWEADFIGNTTQEQNLWATCFANEVTSLRQAAGESFLIDWNPNACYEDVPWANFYPGNSYVDILGLDFYDQGCDQPNTALSFAQLANEPAGLTSFEAFANSQGKPMSFPEWGLISSPSGDDPTYVDGIGSTVENGNFAFQSYFDYVDGNTMLLDSSTPLSLAEYQKWFGNS